MRIKYRLLAVLCFASPSLYAHTGGLVEHSLLSGLLHPLTGIDHLLVLLAVGLVAAKHGGKALFVFPAIFMALMAFGALLNAYGIQIPFVEAFIALSLVMFGLLVGANQKQPSRLFFAGVSLFAVFHGYVHAAEIPVDSGVAVYFSSLMLMSLVICLVGCLLGLSVGKRINYFYSFICLSSGLYYLATL